MTNKNERYKSEIELSDFEIETLTSPIKDLSFEEILIATKAHDKIAIFNREEKNKNPESRKWF